MISTLKFIFATESSRKIEKAYHDIYNKNAMLKRSECGYQNITAKYMKNAREYKWPEIDAEKIFPTFPAHWLTNHAFGLTLSRQIQDEWKTKRLMSTPTKDWFDLSVCACPKDTSSLRVYVPFGDLLSWPSVDTKSV